MEDDNILAQALDQPYIRPLQWKYWEEKYGVGFRPYETPTEEYMQNMYAPSEHQLLYRWEGYGLEVEIRTLFMDPTMPMQRAKIQQIKKRAIGVPDLTDPEDMKIQRAYDIQMAQAHIDRLHHEISTGLEKVVEKVGSMITGFRIVENWRPLSSRSAKDKSSELRDWMKWRMVLEGNASEIIENRGGTSLIEEMKKFAEAADMRLPEPPIVTEIDLPEDDDGLGGVAALGY